jgi:DNA polymerase-1
MWYDNLKERLDAADLAQALTATSWQDRVLGRSETIELPVRCVWVATGNNPDLAGDIPRRCIRIRLDSRVERPWLRTGFQHSPLEAWAWEHRGEQAWAALTLVQAWLDRGRPAWDGARLGSFEAWAEVMGGILQAAGVPGFLGNLDEFYAHVDPEGTAWRAFVAAWWQEYQDDPVLARELLPLAEAAEVTLGGKDETARAKSLGRRLERMRDRVVNGYRIEKAGLEHQTVRWRLRKSEPTDTNPPNPHNPPAPGPASGKGSGGLGGVGGFAQAVQNNVGAPAYRLVTGAADLDRVAAELASARVLGLDCETTGLDPHADRLRLIQLQPPGGPVYVIDCFAVDPRLLEPVLQGARLLVGHNVKFDLRFLMAAGLPIPEGARLFDTMLGGQLLDGSAAPLGLKELAARFLGLKLEKELQWADWSGALSPAMLEYAARDAAVLLPLYEALAPELEAAGLGQAAELEFRALPAVAWLEHTGAPFDVEGWRAVCDRAQAAKLEAASNLTALAARLGVGAAGINWDSPQQVLKLLRAAGVAAEDTREETLARHRDHPLAAGLLAYREAAKRAGTYGLEWLRFVHPLTGRIHADWRQIGAASGRMACTRPNLQNIPRDPQYRACFRPGPGRVLVKADYSQIELRIAAELSGDERMLAAFARGEDLHTLTASVVLGKAPDAVTKEDRQLAKAVNFGLLYGMGSAAFADYARTAYGLTLTTDEAKTLRDRFFAAYPGLKRWHQSQPDGAVAVRTASGRRRLVERFTEKLNSPVQGTGADGLKAALALLWETRQRCPSAVPALAVHDEVVIEADADEAELARDWLVDCMQRGMQRFLRQVPITVEALLCRDWSGTPV